MELKLNEKQQYKIIILSLYLFVFTLFFSNLLGMKIFNYFDEFIGIIKKVKNRREFN